MEDKTIRISVGGYKPVTDNLNSTLPVSTIGHTTDLVENRPLSVGERNLLIRRDCAETLKLALDTVPNLEFTYVRKYDGRGDVQQRGGATLAWQRPRHSSDNILYVSIAWCHSNDVFDKLIGRAYAAEEFIAERIVPIRIRQPGMYSKELKRIFLACL